MIFIKHPPASLLQPILTLLCLTYLTGCMTLITASPQLSSQIQHNLKVCETTPDSALCEKAIHEALTHHAKRQAQPSSDLGADLSLNLSADLNLQSQADLQRQAVHNSTKKVLDIIYNGQQARELFLTRIPNIDSRANFFATNDAYFQTTNMPIRWFGASEYISRRCIFGLGAKGCSSKTTFAVAKTLTNPNLYEWRHDVGSEILQQGFVDFKTLFNQATYQPVIHVSASIYNDTNTTNAANAKLWDNEQLESEQTLAQPIHTNYLEDYPAFLNLSKGLTRVDLLNKESRLAYGHKLLGYESLPLTSLTQEYQDHQDEK